MTDSPRRSPLFWGLFSLALGLLLGSAYIGGALARIKQGDDTVEITGSARRSITSDLASWNGSVSVQAPSLAEASQAGRRYAERVTAFLRQHGADSLIRIGAPEASAIPEVTPNGNLTGRVFAYKVTQRFTYRSRDVAAVGRLAQDVATLTSEGVPIEAGAPEYLYTRLADVRIQMLADATADAKARADAIAKSAGSRIGSVRAVRSGVFQVTPRFSTEVSDYGMNDTSSLEKDITAVVRVVFALR